MLERGRHRLTQLISKTSRLVKREHQPPTFSPDVYSRILWYQQRLPQTIYSNAELTGALIRFVRSGGTVQDFANAKPSQEQLIAAANVLTQRHRDSGIPVVAENVKDEDLRPGETRGIPMDLVGDMVFKQSLAAVIFNVLEYINRIPYNLLRLRNKGVKETEDYTSFDFDQGIKIILSKKNLERVAEFIRVGGRFVDILEMAESTWGEQTRALYQERPDLFAQHQREASAARGYEVTSTSSFDAQGSQVTALEEIRDIVRERTVPQVRTKIPDITPFELEILHLTN